MAQTSNFTLPRPGEIDLDLVNIKNFDGSETQNVSLMVREFNIYESIFSNHMRADVVLEDALSLTTRMPIIGEESVQLRFRTPSEVPNSYAYDWVDLEFYTGKLKNLHPHLARDGVYSIELIPPAHFKNLTGAINYALGPATISDMVKTVSGLIGLQPSSTFNAVANAISGDAPTPGQLVSGTSQSTAMNTIEIENTEGQHQFVIPNLSPYETLNFLASEAKSPTYKASNFIFFQTHKQHYFTTVDYLINRPIKEQYYFFEQSLPTNPAGSADSLSLNMIYTNLHNSAAFRAMARLDFKVLFDVESNLVDGLYDNTVYMIDPLLQRFEPVQVGNNKYFNYFQQFDDFRHTSKSNPSGQAQQYALLTNNSPNKIITPNGRLRNLQGKSHQRMLVTNKYQDSTYGGFPRKRQDFLPWLVSANAQLQTIICEFTVPGDSDRCAGDLVYFDFQELGATDDIIGNLNAYISGAYLVTSVRHKYTASAAMPYLTIMECVKNCYETTIKKA